MKRIIASTAIALATLTGAASAMITNDASLAQIKFYAPTADLSGLTDRDVNVLLSAIHSGDTESEKRRFVQNWIE